MPLGIALGSGLAFPAAPRMLWLSSSASSVSSNPGDVGLTELLRDPTVLIGAREPLREPARELLCFVREFLRDPAPAAGGELVGDTDGRRDPAREVLSFLIELACEALRVLLGVTTGS